jgi:putative phosphoribosyl transferase
MRFPDRTEAGKQLGALLALRVRAHDALVLALPRGGVPVGFEVARALSAPLDVFVVRKLGAPGHEELAMGAIASGGVRVLNEPIIAMLAVSQDMIERVIAREQRELARREHAYRADLPPPEVRNRTVILVDDGIATGATMRAAIGAVRRLHAARIIAATPVAAAEAAGELRLLTDEFHALLTPKNFGGVGQWYGDFVQTTDEDVRSLLAKASERTAGTVEAGPSQPPEN